MQLTWANILTLARLFLAPIFIVFALTESKTGITIALVLFFVAALSDWFDGYLARKYGEVTAQGEFLDPLADKVLTLSAFIVFVMLNIVPLWMVIIVVARDFSTTLMRSIADNKGLKISTSLNAKVKTFAQMVFIVYCLVLLWLSYADPQSASSQNTEARLLLYSASTWWTMLALTLFTLFTAIEYFVQNRKLFRE